MDDIRRTLFPELYEIPDSSKFKALRDRVNQLILHSLGFESWVEYRKARNEVKRQRRKRQKSIEESDDETSIDEDFAQRATIYGLVGSEIALFWKLHELGITILQNYQQVLDFLKHKSRDEQVRREQIPEDRVQYISEVLKNLSLFIKGTEGERLTVLELSRLSKRFRILNNIVLRFKPSARILESDVKQIQIDHVVVGPTGIFSVESKHWGYRTIMRKELRSPALQAHRERIALEELNKRASLGANKAIQSIVTMTKSMERKRVESVDPYWAEKEVKIIPVDMVSEVILSGPDILEETEIDKWTKLLIQQTKLVHPDANFEPMHISDFKVKRKLGRRQPPRPRETSTRTCEICGWTTKLVKSTNFCIDCFEVEIRKQDFHCELCGRIIDYNRYISRRMCSECSFRKRHAKSPSRCIVCGMGISKRTNICRTCIKIKNEHKPQKCDWCGLDFFPSKRKKTTCKYCLRILKDQKTQLCHRCGKRILFHTKTPICNQCRTELGK